MRPNRKRSTNGGLNTAAVKDRSITFSGPMIRAILRENLPKDMTRRVMKPQPTVADDVAAYTLWGDQLANVDTGSADDGVVDEWTCPYGQVGSRLWVKEASWAWGRWIRNGMTATGRQKWLFHAIGHRQVFDKPSKTAQRDGKSGWVYRHARFMPRSRCRILLEVTSIHTERLHALTGRDAIREGMFQGTRGEIRGVSAWENGGDQSCYADPLGAFSGLWDKLNGPRGFGWASNPMVWVVTFKRLEVRQ